MIYWVNGWNGVNHRKDPSPSKEEADRFSREYLEWKATQQ